MQVLNYDLLYPLI